MNQEIFDARLRCLEMARSMLDGLASEKHVFDLAEHIWGWAKKSETPNHGSSGLKPNDFQRELITNIMAKERLLIEKTRQMGITTALAMSAIEIAQSNPNQIGVICANHSSAQHFFEIMKSLTDPDVGNVSKDRLHFPNNSTIIVTALPDRFRGLRIDTLIVDELFHDRVLAEIHQTTAERIIVASTPTAQFDSLWTCPKWNQLSLAP